MFKNLLPEWLTGAAQPKNHAGDYTPGTSSPQDSVDGFTGDGDLTPKAEPDHPAGEVPVFTLNDNEPAAEEEVDSSQEPEVPMFPAANSAQRASAMSTPSQPARSTPGLMLPPGRPGSMLSPRPSAASSSPNGPLPNRGPPAGSQQRVNSRLSSNSVVATPNARGKVLLSPGHSPMDWAVLTRSGNLSGVGTFQRVTPSHLKTMTGRKGKPAWSSWQGKVYNITPYLPFHPGGEAELMKAAGRDGTKLFMDVHPWVNWENMLGSCLVGVMVPEDHGSGGGSLEDMD